MRRYRRTYNFSSPSWLRNLQTIFSDFAIPLTIFQGIRTLLLPTFLDFVILAIFIAATIRLHYKP
ncbi:hypothetical protein SAMN04488168_107136 [Bacillus sp. 491mf]|uniref:hypothetical protein n=1 Tax=Bacillus TaxID=1386 RepID=UPI0005535C68|nr:MULTISPECIES: hypothetical protein [unclassified Bacillus (in: firmicutes)]SFC66465.1 hypothetical protein SAMN04488168_107136 [Bacillus sp. 491mf]